MEDHSLWVLHVDVHELGNWEREETAVRPSFVDPQETPR